MNIILWNTPSNAVNFYCVDADIPNGCYDKMLGHAEQQSYSAQ